MCSSAAEIIDTKVKVDGVEIERLIPEYTARPEIGGSDETKVHGLGASDEVSDV